jgi:hypothetical protein
MADESRSMRYGQKGVLVFAEGKDTKQKTSRQKATDAMTVVYGAGNQSDRSRTAEYGGGPEENRSTGDLAPSRNW